MKIQVIVRRGVRGIHGQRLLPEALRLLLLMQIQKTERLIVQAVRRIRNAVRNRPGISALRRFLINLLQFRYDLREVRYSDLLFPAQNPAKKANAPGSFLCPCALFRPDAAGQKTPHFRRHGDLAAVHELCGSIFCLLAGIPQTLSGVHFQHSERPRVDIHPGRRRLTLRLLLGTVLPRIA